MSVSDMCQPQMGNGSHFFQTIHPHTTESRKLELPRKFVTKFGKELSEVAVIMVPDGMLWRVELRKTEEEISFQNGWQEFMDYYSICVGQILVFRYDGNSYFHVLVFDHMSRSEIEYRNPCHTQNFKEHNHEEKSRSCATSEIPSANAKEEPKLVLVPSDSESDDDPSMSTPPKVPSSCGCNVWCSNKRIDNRPESSRIGFSAPQVNRRNEHESSAQALRAASEFKSENPFCTVTMRPSYVSEKFILNVPMAIGKYLIWKTQSVTLRVSDEKTWKIQCMSAGHQVKLVKGWKEFVVDHGLRKGDVCVFELVGKNIKVYIYRAS